MIGRLCTCTFSKSSRKKTTKKEPKLNGFSKQEPELDNDRELRPANYSQGDRVRMVVKDIPEGQLPNGKKLLPVAFSGDFVCILSEYPPNLRVGDTVDVVLLKITKSHSHKAMAFGAVLNGTS